MSISLTQMMIRLEDRVTTAGAYVYCDGHFLFQVGPTTEGDRLGVVRLGGHTENDETALETAKREVFEESSIRITPYPAPETYFQETWDTQPQQVNTNDEISPILVKGRKRGPLSVMYLAHSNTNPEPSSETAGILLLTPKDIERICHNYVSLKEFLQIGGKAILKKEMDQNLTLTPFPQLLFLAKLLTEKLELMRKFMQH